MERRRWTENGLIRNLSRINSTESPEVDTHEVDTPEHNTVLPPTAARRKDVIELITGNEIFRYNLHPFFVSLHFSDPLEFPEVSTGMLDGRKIAENEIIYDRKQRTLHIPTFELFKYEPLTKSLSIPTQESAEATLQKIRPDEVSILVFFGEKDSLTNFITDIESEHGLCAYMEPAEDPDRSKTADYDLGLAKLDAINPIFNYLDFS